MTYIIILTNNFPFTNFFKGRSFDIVVDSTILLASISNTKRSCKSDR